MPQEHGRNDPCPCGSGKKYKKCCWQKNHTGRARRFSASPLASGLKGVQKTFSGAIASAESLKNRIKKLEPQKTPEKTVEENP